MKTINANGSIKRVDNATADRLVGCGKAKFCQKSEWKKIRDSKKEKKAQE